jgi:DNA-binding CsgD family transcriptional regulator/PAS domain-containing protein
MQTTQNDLPDPIPHFYDAAIGEASWDEALAALTARLGGASIMLGFGCPKKPSISAYWIRNFSTGPLAEAGYLESDIANPQHNPDIRAALTMPVGRTMDSRNFISEEEMQRTPFLQAAMLTQDISTHHLFVAVRDAELVSGGFAAHRGGRELGASSVRELDRVLPHIARALRLRGQVARCQTLQASLLCALECLSEGVVIVDPGLRVLYANTAAEDIFAARDGLRQDRGCLRTTRDPQVRLTERVRACQSPGSADATGGPIAVPRRSGLAAYLLEVFPAIGAAGLPGSTAAGAILVIRDPVAAPVLADPDALVSAFGLTPAEARVARLAPLAESKRAVAERLGLSENTVKTHLAAIRGKLGVRNMTEVAQVIDRSQNGRTRPGNVAPD